MEDYIEYKGINYPCREIYLPKIEQYVTVSVTALQDELDKDNEDKSDEDIWKETVDSRIFFYLSDEEYSLPDDMIVDLLNNIL